MNEASTAQWKIQQLIKSRLFPDEQAVLRSALRALYQLQPEIKQQMVIRAYTAGEISLGKAGDHGRLPRGDEGHPRREGGRDSPGPTHGGRTAPGRSQCLSTS